MVDWNSPQELANDAKAFDRLIHCLLGVYIWEWAISLDFEWQFFSRKREWRWTLVFYLLNRYCLLFALIGIAIALNVTQEVNCQNLYTFNQCFGNAAIGLASINLSIRTVAVWKRSKIIIIPLVLVILGHWSLLLHGVLLKAAWVEGQGCVITHTDNKLLAVTFIYSMVFDFVVLLLTAYKLLFPSGISKEAFKDFKDAKISPLSSTVVTILVGDGLIYFLIAFLVNLIATVFMLLNLNPVMSIVANVPAAIASTIVACRVVRRLHNHYRPGRQETSQGTGSTLAFRTTISAYLRPNKKISTKVSTASKSEGVHVQMQTFESPIGKNAYNGYDASGNASVGDIYDPEAQGNPNEFKSPPY